MEHKTGRCYAAVTAVLLLGAAVYELLHITGPVMLPDEFGYWANAAQLLGYDWRDAVSLQSYYSFGYSLWLLPFLKWIREPAVMYKAAIVLNVAFVYLQALLLWKLAGRMHPEKGESRLLFCLFAAFYPGVLFNMQLTWTESFSGLLFVLSVWLMGKYCSGKKRLYAALLCLCLFYLCTVHMRMLGVAAAGVITLFVMLLMGKGKISGKASGNFTWKKALSILAGFVLALAFCGAGLFLKEYFQSGVYAKADQALLAVNDFKGQAGKIARLFTAEGLADFAVSCAGKLFYLGLASLGSVYFGVWHVLKRIRRNPVYLYLLLAAVFTFGITALYTMGGGRADSYLYGRYNEFMAPVFIYFGLCEMRESHYTLRVTAALTALHAGMAYMLTQVMAASDPGRFQGYFTVGISYAFPEYLSDSGQYAVRAFWAGSAGLLLLSFVLGFLTRKKKEAAACLAVFIGLYVYTGLSAGGKYLYDHSIDSGADMELAGVVKERLEEEEEIVFVNSDSDQQYVDILQFALKEQPVRVVQEQDFTPEQGELPEYVFVYQGAGKEVALEKAYDTVRETYHFKLYYNEN